MLEEYTFNKIVSLVNKGKIFTKKKQYEKALGYYTEAEGFFSEPIIENTGAETLYILIGDVYFEAGDFEKSRKFYNKSRECKDKGQLLLSLFKIGKAYYEEENKEEAKKIFIQVYNKSGKKYFLPEEVKYYRLIEIQKSGVKEEVKKSEPKVFKVYKDKNYTQAEWKVLEQLLYEEYLRKNKK